MIAVQVTKPEVPGQTPPRQLKHPFNAGLADHAMLTVIDSAYPSTTAAYFALVGQIGGPVIGQAAGWKRQISR